MNILKQTVARYLKEYLPVCIKDVCITIGSLAASTLICMILRTFDNSDVYVSMIFILAVFLISRYTNGYLYGVIAAFVSVLAVNFIFTYPYFKFNFTLSGYPLTVVCMLAVAIITGALTTQIKRQSEIKFEAEKEKMRSNLLRAVSHDLRTPLTSILGATSAIIESDDMLGKEQRLQLLLGIKEDSQWLIRMVENLLSITRIDEGATAKIIKQPEAAEELVAEAVSKFYKSFPAQKVEVQVPDELLFVPMDAILIEQVIINLLENAVVHSMGATKINLRVFVQERNAVFEVSDNGVGIPKEILPHVLEGKLMGSSKERTDAKRNMGIGLSVCNTIIKAHHGVMSAKNGQESGAVFTFSLPLGENNYEQ